MKPATKGRVAGRLAPIAAIAIAAVLVAVIAVLKFPEKPRRLEPLVLGGGVSALATPVWVAAAKDYFRDEGLDVTARQFELGRDALAEMFAGEIDVATAAVTPIVIASFTRNDFVVFGNISYVDTDCKIIARRDRGIRRAADLKGKTVAITRGTSVEYFFDAFLAHHAVAREALVIRNMAQSEMPDALSRGKIDAAVTFEPYGLESRKRLGDAAVVITAPEVYRETFHLVARRKFARDRPEALVRFLRAIARAQIFIYDHPADAQVIMAQRSGMSPGDIATIWPGFHFDLALRQSLLPLFEDEARWSIRRGLAPAGSSVPNYLDVIYPDALKAVAPEAVTIIH